MISPSGLIIPTTGASISFAVPNYVWASAARQLGVQDDPASLQIRNLRKNQAAWGYGSRVLDRRFPFPRGPLSAIRERMGALLIPGTGAIFKPEVWDAKGQGDLRKAKKLWDYDDPVSSDLTISGPVNRTEHAFLKANELILGANQMIAELTGGQVSVLVPLLSGALHIVKNFDPDPTDVFGWTNLAAVSGAANEIGTILLGLLRTAEEKRFFLDPVEEVEALWHEFGHLIEGCLNKRLPYIGSDGAIKEYFADLFAKFMMQTYIYGNDDMPALDVADPVSLARWSFGDAYLKDVDGKKYSLRHYLMVRAYDNHPLLGTDIANHKWPLLTTRELGWQYECARNADEGGVHLDSSAPSHVAALQVDAMAHKMLNALRIAAYALALSNLAQEMNLGLIGFSKYEWLAAHYLAKKGLVPAAAVKVVEDSWDTKGIPAKITDQDLADNANLAALVTLLKKKGFV